MPVTSGATATTVTPAVLSMVSPTVACVFPVVLTVLQSGKIFRKSAACAITRRGSEADRCLLIRRVRAWTCSKLAPFDFLSSVRHSSMTHLMTATGSQQVTVSRLGWELERPQTLVSRLCFGSESSHDVARNQVNWTSTGRILQYLFAFSPHCSGPLSLAGPAHHWSTPH